MLLQEESNKLKRAIENNDTALIQHMFQGNSIDVNANINIDDVRMYVLFINTVYVYTIM